MNNLKPSHFLAALAWVSLFALTWLNLLDMLAYDAPFIAAWLFFMAVAVVASAMASPPKKI